MQQSMLECAPAMATLATLTVADSNCLLTAKGVNGTEYIRDRISVGAPALVKSQRLYVPLEFFRSVMHAYVTQTNNCATIERTGNVIEVIVSAGPVPYVEAEDVLSRMDVDYHLDVEQGEVHVIVEARKAGLRELTPAELALPYAKYYTDYWKVPFYERTDVKAWGRKAHLYQLYSRQDYRKMLHIRDSRKLLDPAFRANEWTEGWTLFPDGTGVMCAKTEFPGTTAEAFQWWFAWHVKEDLRYMLWFPPAHYGIAPTLELQKKFNDPANGLFELTHGGNTVHMVYESTQIDAASCSAARPIEWHPIPFHDPSSRHFTKEDLMEMERQHCVAICGGTKMLHFFAENVDGTGGTLYTHFWFGTVPDGKGGWMGNKSEEDPSIIQPILNIGQHGVKEFSRLADILPDLYREEGKKPL